MQYILNPRYRLRGWAKAPCGLYDTILHQPVFFPPEVYPMIARCDGVHEIDPEALSDTERKLFRRLEAEQAIRPAGFAEFLLPEQEYRKYPARYRQNVEWSVTGACNLRCRHCFMSAPHAKHGQPTFAQLMNIADQLAECGIFRVGLTGGEPLTRTDFPDN